MRAETQQARLSPVLCGLAFLFLLPAVAGAQLTHYEILDGPGKGEVIAAGKASKPGKPKPVNKNNNPINKASGKISEPDSGCKCNHYHGSLNGKRDPRGSGVTDPLGCGWGCVAVVGKKSKPSTRIRSALLYEVRGFSEFKKGDRRFASAEVFYGSVEVFEVRRELKLKDKSLNRATILSRITEIFGLDLKIIGLFRSFDFGRSKVLEECFDDADLRKRTLASTLEPLGM